MEISGARNHRSRQWDGSACKGIALASWVSELESRNTHSGGREPTPTNCRWHPHFCPPHKLILKINKNRKWRHSAWGCGMECGGGDGRWSFSMLFSGPSLSSGAAYSERSFTVSTFVFFSSSKPSSCSGRTKKYRGWRFAVLWSQTKCVSWLTPWLPPAGTARCARSALGADCCTQRLGQAPGFFSLIHGLKWNFPERFASGRILLFGRQVLSCGRQHCSPPSCRHGQLIPSAVTPKRKEERSFLSGRTRFWCGFHWLA